MGKVAQSSSIKIKYVLVQPIGILKSKDPKPQSLKFFEVEVLEDSSLKNSKFEVRIRRVILRFLCGNLEKMSKISRFKKIHENRDKNSRSFEKISTSKNFQFQGDVEFSNFEFEVEF